jgi:hypothetical protein
MKILIPIIIIISGLILIFWCIQFLKLMRMKTEDFPSKEDKAIWAVVMILLNFLGAFLFWIEFKPEIEAYPQLDTDQYKDIRDIDDELYEEAKSKFPDHLEEFDLTLKILPYDKLSLEKYYSKKSPQDLVACYRKGSKVMRPGCFGILLTVITARNLEI